MSECDSMTDNDIECMVDSIREIAKACENPFGKDAKKARRIALDALEKFGRN